MGNYKNMHIVLVDFISEGHHETYLRQFIKCLLEMGNKLTVFYPQNKKLTAWLESELPEYSSLICINEITEYPIQHYSRFSVLQKWKIVKKIIRTNHLKPNLVFFAWVDDFRFRKDHPLLDRFYLKWVEWFFPYMWSGLYFHPVHLRNEANPVNKYSGYDIDDIFKLKNCTSVCLLDKEIRKKLENKIHKPVIHFPDFTDDRINELSEVANGLKIKANGRKIVLLIGALMKRKGIFTFLEAAKQSIDEPWLFVIAGKIFRNYFSDDELRLIDDHILHPRRNVIIYPYHLEESEFNAIVNICHILYAAYLDFPHTSNMLNKASIYHKPLVVSKGFYMDEVVSKFKIGEVINETNPIEARIAIKKILETENYINREMREGFELYRIENSVEKLRSAFQEVLRIAAIR